MSQEERSELSTEPVSDLSGEETEAAVNIEDSDNYAWDNYREDPSFVERDPEEEDLALEREVTVPITGRRASSTDYQFLEDHSAPSYQTTLLANLLMSREPTESAETTQTAKSAA